MKSSTILKLKAAGMAGLLGASAMFAGCPNPSSPKHEPKVCECPDPEHLGIGETCDCGGEDCACGLKVYGQLANGVKIYRSGEVSDAEMAAVVANAQAEYDGMLAGAKENLEGKIGDIYILPVANDKNSFYKNIDGKLVCGVKCVLPSVAIRGVLNAIVNGVLTLEVSVLNGDALVPGTIGVNLSGTKKT